MFPATDLLGVWHKYLDWWDCVGPKNSHVSLSCSVRTYRGFGALPGKRLLVRIIEINKIDAHCRAD